ncbi:MAG: PHP domain-containing protein, partial [Coriobacteriales bacterium]
MSGFVHLHVHSRFSFMDGAADLDALIGRAVELGMPALALTDHQGLYGSIRFYQKALAAGLRPILCAEVVV